MEPGLGSSLLSLLTLLNSRHALDTERGATAVEYGLFVALVAAVCIGTVALLGGVVEGLYKAVQWW